jgi:pimeloyl-ACP methyl ester carboxylesterase
MMYIHDSGPVDQQTVIFLHGNGSNGTMWKSHMASLSSYHCLAPDLPGFGRSNHREWFSIDEVVSELVELIRAHAVEQKVHLVGLSLGGSLAIQLIGAVPGLLDSALVDGAGVLPVPGLAILKIGLRLAQPFLHSESIIRMISQWMVKIPEEDYEEFKKGMLSVHPASFTRAIIQANQMGQPLGLRHAPCRVLFVAGENEPSTTHRSNAMLTELMPKAHYRVVRSVGHGWMSEEADLHIRMVEAWIKNSSLPHELVRAGF